MSRPLPSFLPTPTYGTCLIQISRCAKEGKGRFIIPRSTLSGTVFYAYARAGAFNTSTQRTSEIAGNSIASLVEMQGS